MHADDVRPRRTPRVPAIRLASVTALALVAVAAIAAADHPVGPGFGNNRFKTAIETGPQGIDVDDYTAVLAAGDRLSFTVKSPFQSPLLPEIHLLDPTGRDRIAEGTLKERSGGKTVTLKPYTIDRTGTWAVRVAGRIGTEGTYIVSFKVSAPARSDLRDQELGSSGTTEATYAVEAAEGSSLDVDVSWSKGAAPVSIVAVEDPNGRPVTNDEGQGAEELTRNKKKGAKLRKLRLEGGSGTYAIRVRAADGATSYRIRWRVRAPQRPNGLRKLESVEPHIARGDIDPILGVEDSRIRVDGWNFSTAGAPRVLFDDVAGRDVIVDPSGGFLEVTVPAGVDDSTVAISAINPDGQGSRADDAFHYVAPPVITSVVDASGAPLTGADAAGGVFLRIEGAHLRTGQLVQIGTGPQMIPVVRDGGLEMTTRAQAPEIAFVRVSDSFGHEAFSPLEFEIKAAPVFDGSPYSPAVAGTAGDTEVIVRGQGFEATDELYFDDELVSFDLVSPAILRFTPPARADGLYSVGSRDRFGLIAVAPSLRLKAPGVIDDVAPVAGSFVGGTEISIHGGTVVDVTGSLFHVHDIVRVGDAIAPGTLPTGVRLQATAAAAASAGLVDVTVTDILGQETTATDALRYVGFRDRSAARAPTRTSIDDRSALRGAVGDLDRDGAVDDLVLVSHDSVSGTRAERTRILIGGTSGSLADATATRLPSAGSDDSGVDDLRATAVAIGDLDGTDGPDIVIAGLHPDGEGYGEVRWLVNDGYGAFDLDEAAVPGSTYAARIRAEDENGVGHEIRSPRIVRGRPTALAIGDLDDDGDLDVVVGRDSFEVRRFGIDEAAVDFGQTPPYISAADAVTYLLDETHYYPAVRVIENRLSAAGGLVDVTDTNVPTAGTGEDTTPLPAFHARDLALADVDGDDDLDLIVTWDDPTTVTAFGLNRGSGTDTARVATRVLLNDGDGVFTDETDDWMPAGSSFEWYQATRLAVTDLDGDGDPDLVLVHSDGIGAFQGSPLFSTSALRVLRNDHDPSAGTGGFTDVTSTAVPAVSTTSDDNYRGVALRVADVDGDGTPDILIGATSPPVDDDTSAPVGALRLLSGTPGALAFRDNSGFIPPLADDTGEADDLLLIPDLSAETRPALLILSETVPATSTGSRYLRVLDWQR